jgi:hypothetical protein
VQWDSASHRAPEAFALSLSRKIALTLKLTPTQGLFRGTKRWLDAVFRMEYGIPNLLRQPSDLLADGDRLEKRSALPGQEAKQGEAVGADDGNDREGYEVDIDQKAMVGVVPDVYSQARVHLLVSQNRPPDI